MKPPVSAPLTSVPSLLSPHFRQPPNTRLSLLPHLLHPCVATALAHPKTIVSFRPLSTFRNLPSIPCPVGQSFGYSRASRALRRGEGWRRKYSAGGPEPRKWTFEELQHLSQNPQKGRIIVDVREPAELLQTGRVPTAFHMPITSNPDAIFLPEAEFVARFGFAKPGSGATADAGAGGGSDRSVRSSFSSSSSSSSSYYSPSSSSTAPPSSSSPSSRGENAKAKELEEEVKEVVFYCRAGVRSATAARLASGEGGWEGVRVGDLGGGWLEWERKGGGVEKG